MLAALQEETSTSNYLDVEQKALALFSGTSSDNYHQMVIYLTYRAIEANPSITVRALRWVLKKYGIDKDLIDMAINVLLSKEIFGAIHYYQATKSKGVKHYKINANNELMEDWVMFIKANRPELCKFNVTKPKR